MPAGYVWKHTDGSRGSALFKPDGSTSTTVIKSDGTYKRYANDGKGNVVVIDYNRAGQQTGYTWWRADGSRGSEVSDGAGGRTGTVMRSDGSYANYSDDGHGNSSRTLYNAEGGFVSNEWRRDDGSAGGISRGIDGSTTVFSTDGRGGGTQTTYRPDGVVHQTVVDSAGVRTVLDDGEGTRIETQWGANGVGIVANTVVRYNADGSGTSTTTDADGRVTEKHFARGELGPWTAPPTPDDRPWFPPKDGKIEPIWPDDPWVPSDPPVDPDCDPCPEPPVTPQKDPVPPSGDGGQVDPGTAGSFAGATAAAPRRDPLVLDLDDDGIETVGVNTANPLMFDIAATGIKQSVGWVKRDDGFLVLDRNGNGSIDSGAELFGDATTLANGQKAVDGFAALAEFDVNHDGKIDTADVRFADLRVWRDLNQDGVSQASELSTLGSLGIAALNVGNTSHSTVLSNGNRIADVGTYVKTTGELGGLGETAQSADVDLAVDTFRSQFTDHLDTSSVASLPDMQGAGQVRSLREAATLNSALATLLGQFAVATDRATQQGLIDGILKQWSNTSTMAATFTGAYAGHALTVNVQGIAAGSATYQAWADRLTILERFNGRTFNAVPAGTAAATVNLWTTSQALLQQSYDHLKASVYQSLALQTRLRPYLDKIGLTVTATGVKLDFSALRTEFDARFAADQASTLADLVDFSLGTRQRLKDSGWDSTREITRYLDQVSITPAIQASLVSAGILVDGAANWNAGGTGADDLMVGHGGNETFAGGDGQDTLYGGAGNDNLYGGGGNDTLSGGADNDTLKGGTGNDVLDGGSGTDALNGGSGNANDGLGNDTYLFGRGDGTDTIYDQDSTAGNSDTIRFKDGVLPSDVTLSRPASASGDLLLSINGTADSLRVYGWFADTASRVERVEFADGSV